MEKPNANSESLISGKMLGATVLLVLAIILAAVYPSKDVIEQSTQAVQNESTYEISKLEETSKRAMPRKAAVTVPGEEEEGC